VSRKDSKQEEIEQGSKGAGKQVSRDTIAGRKTKNKKHKTQKKGLPEVKNTLI
jgi:hypothetical protein